MNMMTQIRGGQIAHTVSPGPAVSDRNWVLAAADYARAKRAEDAFYTRFIDSIEPDRLSDAIWDQVALLTEDVSSTEAVLMAVPSADLRALALKVSIACVENGTLNETWLVALQVDAKRLLEI